MTARYIKQVETDPKWLRLILHDTSAQMSQQSRTRRRSLLWSLDQPVTRIIQVTDNKYSHTTVRRALMPRMCTRTRRDARMVEIQYIFRVSSVKQRNFNASLATSMDTLDAYVIKRNKLHSSQGNQRLICCKQELCMLVTSPYAATQKIVHPGMSHSVYKSRSSMHKLNVSGFPHHPTWLLI